MPSSPSKPAKVLLVDDHAIFRQGLRMLIESQPGLQVVGEAQDRGSALPLTAREQPDVVLLDLDLGAESGLDLIGDMLAAAPKARVLVLTGVRNAEVRRRAFHLGAIGLVEKEAATDVLLKAIEKICDGEVWLDRATTADVLAEMSGSRRALHANSEAAKIARLSAREREITGFIGEGLCNKRIAERMFISETTVRHHLTSIFDKLSVHDRLELVVYAFRHGLVKPPAA